MGTFAVPFLAAEKRLPVGVPNSRLTKSTKNRIHNTYICMKKHNKCEQKNALFYLITRYTPAYNEITSMAYHVVREEAVKFKLSIPNILSLLRIAWIRKLYSCLAVW